MKRILIKNLNAIVTVDEEDNLLENQNIYIENGVIEYIGKELKEADEIINGTNHYAYPGLVNTHHHFYQTFTRNLPKVQNYELFNWLKILYKIWEHLDDEMIYYSTLTALGDLMKYGCTTSFDHHYIFPAKATKTLIDTQFFSAEEIGMRFHASRGSMSRSIKDGGLSPDTLVQTTGEILKDSLRLIEKYHNSDKFSMRQVALAPCSPFSVTEDLMKESSKLARSMGVRLHTHLCETIDEENYTLSNVKLRPLAYMELLDWIGDDVWFAHGIHFNDKELKLLADTKTGIAHCPISNMKLSSGIARIPEMIKMGIPVGLAVDGSASNDGSNLLEEIRVAYLLHRLNSSFNAPVGYDILKLATKGGAAVLGRDDIGSLEVGKAADLFLVNIKNLSMVGVTEDPKSIFSIVGYNMPVDYTIINGEVVVRNGKLVKIDEDRVIEKAQGLVRKLLDS